MNDVNDRWRDFGWGLFGFVVGVLWAFYVASLIHPVPRTPAEWKAGYKQSLKAEQARHAEAMGMGKENK